MKNRLSDLNDHLFAQIERLSDEEMTPEKIEAEVKRGKALAEVADKIIANAALQLDAVKMLAMHGDRTARYLAPMLEGQKATPKPEAGP